MIRRVGSVGKTAVTNVVEVALEATKIKVLALALGAAGFGGLSLINSLFGSLGTLASWGLTSSTADLLRKAPDHEERLALAADCARFTFILLAVAFPAALVWLAVARYTYADYLTWHEVFLIAAILPVPVLMGFARGYLVGSGTTNQVLALRMLTPMLVLLGVAMSYGAGVLAGPIEAFILTMLPAGAVALWLTSGILRKVLTRPRLPSRAVSAKLVTLGAAFTASSFLQEGGVLMVKTWMSSLSGAGLVQVGLYTAAIAICSLPTRVAQSYFGIYRARLMSSAASDPTALSAELFRSTWIIMVVGIAFSSVIYLSAGFIITTFMTKDFLPARAILEGIAPTIPLRLATVPFVYKRFITGGYVGGLAIEVLGVAGLAAGTVAFYDPLEPSSIVIAHWVGAALPLLGLGILRLADNK